MSAPLLWYVHHHGSGHWRRALAVSRLVDREVVYLSSSAPAGPLPPGHRLVRLPLDAPASQHGATAHGRFHWAPTHHAGLLARQALMLATVQAVSPALAVVDVSVEVTVLLRGAGVPVVAVRLPGERHDSAHRLGFDVADQVVMPVPEAWNLHAGAARTTAVGLVSGLGGLPEPPPPPGPPRVVVLVGRGGSRLDLAQCARLALECPQWSVTVLGLPPAAGQPDNLRMPGHVDDPGEHLASAAVVVGNCGLGTVADVVRVGRPLIVVPEERPFGEQAATAAALRDEAVVLDDLPGPRGWPHALDAAVRSGPPRLAADGAARFADLIESAARREDDQRVSVRS
jgi:UDP-N-acetylglucosamine--N-acetylmuramyl-(pentapeptide) pyrophosphoryl-undecaprenol N-acetylglucosamine transferase